MALGEFWVPRPSLNVTAEDFASTSCTKPDKNTTRSQHALAENQAADWPANPRSGEADDMDRLVESLSPVKRRRVPIRADSQAREDAASGIKPQDESVLFPLPLREVYSHNEESARLSGSQAASERTDLSLDQKRVARMRERRPRAPSLEAPSLAAASHRHRRATRSGGGEISTYAVPQRRRKGPRSAALVLDFRPQLSHKNVAADAVSSDNDEDGSALRSSSSTSKQTASESNQFNEKARLVWYASRAVLRGCSTLA